MTLILTIHSKVLYDIFSPEPELMMFQKIGNLIRILPFPLSYHKGVLYFHSHNKKKLKKKEEKFLTYILRGIQFSLTSIILI